MRIRLYFDEDSMDRNLMRALRARDVDVTTALDENMIERTDAEHLDFALRQGRVLFSFNRGDFLQLHSQYLATGKSPLACSLHASSGTLWVSKCAVFCI